MTHSRTTRADGGQATVETAFTLVLFLFMVFAIIDVGRFLYIRSLAYRDADAAARALVVTVPGSTDCPAQKEAVQSGNGVSIKPDPASVAGNASPIPPNPAPAMPPAGGSGYLYLYPAIAQSAANCAGSGGNRPVVASDAAVVTYRFQASTPLLSPLLGNLIIRAIDVVPSAP